MAGATATHDTIGRRLEFRCALALACCLGGMAGSQVRAMDLVSVVAQRDGEAYLLNIEALFEASPERLLEVLTDYDRLHELHPRMLESRSLGFVGPATEEVYTQIKGCVMFFCRTLHRVESIREEPGRLLAVEVAGRSSFREGRTDWRYAPEGSGTRLVYQARLVPAFWVPSVLDAAALARSLEHMVVEMMGEAELRAADADD